MKKPTIIFILLMGISCASGQGNAQSDSSKPSQSASTDSGAQFKNENERISYALGMRLALELKILQKNVQLDSGLIAQGLKDSLSGGKTRLSNDERVAILSQLQKDLEMKEQAMKQQLAVTNLKEGEAFMAANRGKEGVVTLPSGLQYKVLVQGTGPKPTYKDTVVCNYRGTLLDGKEFDSSYKRGEPSTFHVMGVIPGWTEALQLMPVGSKWQLFVPPNLAYAERGAGRDIEPNATLIFEIELLSIKEPEPESAPAK